jgi:hypothetical protein
VMTASLICLAEDLALTDDMKFMLAALKLSTTKHGGFQGVPVISRLRETSM